MYKTQEETHVPGSKDSLEEWSLGSDVCWGPRWDIDEAGSWTGSTMEKKSAPGVLISQ